MWPVYMNQKLKSNKLVSKVKQNKAKIHNQVKTKMFCFNVMITYLQSFISKEISYFCNPQYNSLYP